MVPDDPQRLEIKLSFLEKHVEEQDRVILDLSRRCDRMERLLRLIAAKDDKTDPLPDNERPPHY